MNKLIYKTLTVFIVLISSFNTANAYITVPSTSYTLEVGVDQFLSVPDPYYGYIDHAVWACLKPEIEFIEKDEAGAIIKITNAFSGSAVVEVLATERYHDFYGKLRAVTYYKQYVITCQNGPSLQESNIILPDLVTLTIGESKHFKVLSGSCYNGAFDLSWKNQSKKNFAYFNVNWASGDIAFIGAMVGDGILTVSTAAGEKKDCRIKVESTDVVSNKRTDKKAVSDIKYLIANVLQISDYTSVDDITSNENKTRDSNDIYDIRGVLIKRNATLEEVISLPSGIYIFNGHKFVIQ